MGSRALDPQSGKVDGADAPLLGAGGAPGTERKTVTILFCDIVDYTVQTEDADPEDVHARMLPYYRLVRTLLESNGGTVEKFVGDAVMGVFGAPAAHEDDPERAVRAGLRIVEAIEALSERQAGFDLNVRIGIETGNVLVTSGARPELGEPMVTGAVANTASRLQGVAPAGAVAVGSATYEATKHVFDYEELPEQRVKGKAVPLAMYRAIAPRSVLGAEPTRPYAAPFVGREEERNLLHAVFSRCVKDSSCQLVTLCGEPGIGKSRLVADLFEYLAAARDPAVRWRRGRCLPYGDGVTFWALGEIVKGEAGIGPSDDPEMIRTKLDRTLPPVAADRDWMVQRLLPLVGVGATRSGADRDESFAAWRRYFEQLAQRPTVLVFEDVHWADPAFVMFLLHLVEQAAAVPLMILTTARPEFFEREPLFGATIRNATRLDLAPLGEAEMDTLLDHLLEGTEASVEVRAAIATRSGGIPLFAEESVRLLLERDQLGLVAADQGGPGPSARVSLPSSISSIIAARLDSLAPPRKALLADASVVGETFWPGAVAHISGLARQEVEEALRHISRLELVRKKSVSAMPGELEYGFWHALVRDVAYGQLPRLLRAEKHLRVADWLEATAAEDRVEDVAEILASHYAEAVGLFRAGGRTDRVEAWRDRAVRWFTLAGDRATALDGARAEAYYRQALDLLPEEHPDRPRVLGSVAETAHINGKSAEAVELYERAIAASASMGESDVAADLRIRYSVVLSGLGRSNDALALLDELIRNLEPAGPSAPLARAHAERAYPFGALPYQDALAEANQALELAEHLQLPAVRARALGFRGSARVALGDPAGLDDVRTALRLSLDLHLTRPSYVTYINLVALTTYEDPAAARDVAAEGLRYVRRRGLAEGESWIRTYELQAMFQLGRWDELVAASEEIGAWATSRGYDRNAMIAAYPKLLVLLLRGSVGRAADLAARSSGAAAALGSGELFGLPRIAMLREGGQEAEAGRAAEELVTAFEGHPNGVFEQACELSRQAVAVGRADVVERVTKLLGGDLRLARAARTVCRALLAQAEGRWHDALDAFVAAEAQWRAFGNPYERAQALLGVARCRVEVGARDDVRAAALLVRAGARARGGPDERRGH